MLTIALLGACPAQLSRFAAAMNPAAHAFGHQVMLVTAGADALPSNLPGFDLVLLAGLEAPFPLNFPAPDTAARLSDALRLEATDQSIRNALALAGASYRVLYGTDAERLALALQAVESLLPATLRSGQAARPSGPKNKPWVWMCDKCSDPQCEHRLLTALLAQRGSIDSTPAQPARPLLNR